MGWLEVPESHTRQGSGRLRLAVLRLRSTARSPGPPIIYLSGGPGGSGTAALRDPHSSRLPLLLTLREVADVIAIDQRGTGLSKPDLPCAEIWSYPFDQPADREGMLAVARERSRTCAARLRAAGIDLAAYNTEEIADDLEDLRRALGVPRIDLLATSFGTQVALTAMRRHERSLGRVVLAGVEAPHQALRLPGMVDRQLAEIDRALAGGLAGGGSLVRTLRELLGRLEREPVSVDVPQPLAGRTARVVAGRFDLEAMVVEALAERRQIATLAGQLQAMAAGDWSALGRFALGLRRSWLGAAMPYAVRCAAGASAARREQARREAAGSLLGRALDFPFPEICDAWQVPDLGDGFRAPVRSRLPALLVSGTLDARTPPENAREVLAGFPRGVHLVVEGAGHGDDLLVSTPELPSLLAGFFRGKRPARKRLTLPPLLLAPSLHPY
jgi:pimeloyl-ACP methyl ester carboxylesterase